MDPRCVALVHEILRVEYDAQKSGNAERSERERRRIWGELGEHLGVGPPPPGVLQPRGRPR